MNASSSRQDSTGRASPATGAVVTSHARLRSTQWKPLLGAAIVVWAAGWLAAWIGSREPIAVMAAFIPTTAATLVLAISVAWQRRSITFTRDGLMFEDARDRFVLPWNGLSADLIEVGGVPAVRIHVFDARSTLEGAARMQGEASVSLRRIAQRVARPLVVVPSEYGAEAQAFLAAIETCTRDPSCRYELPPASQ